MESVSADRREGGDADRGTLQAAGAESDGAGQGCVLGGDFLFKKFMKKSLPLKLSDNEIKNFFKKIGDLNKKSQEFSVPEIIKQDIDDQWIIADSTTSFTHFNQQINNG